MRVAEVCTSDKKIKYVVLDDDGNFIEPIARYLKFLDLCERSNNTLRTYAINLMLFFRYLKQENLDFHNVTIDEMAGFIYWLKQPYKSIPIPATQPIKQTRANTTINHVVKTVSNFYSYLWRSETVPTDLNSKLHTQLRWYHSSYKSFLHGIIKDRSISKNILKQPIPKQRPKIITLEQVQQLIAACKNQRDRLLLAILYESGIRIGEALSLWLEDIDLARYQIQIKDHGDLPNKASIKTSAAIRKIQVSPELVYQIMDYVAVTHTENVNTNHLFIKEKGINYGQPLDYIDVSNLFHRLKRKTGINASAHTLRHTSLTNLAKAGMKPEMLRIRAGHTNFQYTYQLYIHPDETDLSESWKKINLNKEFSL